MPRNIMNRSSRRIIAWLGILGIAFAQFVATANACAPGAASGADRYEFSAPGTATVGAGHCGEHAAPPATPAKNLCEVHCSDGATPVTALDLPTVALAPLPVPAMTLAALAADAPSAGSYAAVAVTGPPIVLQFGHLLI
jgi:hypothetical protein